ncbi:hypothetical protein [Streptomyces sp. NBC_01591]|uniref:hypothetical protein n=1 Tax=Streptomyces sp. NBC_01591 TaxID=2975888 RepID=UPI002DDB3736|nr:hypothetical protein [Streptomyces sp. NBC_01591]
MPRGRKQPLWWTLRRPYRPLTYHGAHRMFERVNTSLGADWTLHDLRHRGFPGSGPLPLHHHPDHCAREPAPAEAAVPAHRQQGAPTRARDAAGW